MKNTNVHIAQDRASFEDLISGLTETGFYSHLRLILTKNNDRTLKQKYLMISRNAFGLVRLYDVDFDDNHISMALQDLNTGIVKNVHLEIDDTSFRFILISWQDIQEIFSSDSNSSSVGDELLEFEF